MSSPSSTAPESPDAQPKGGRAPDLDPQARELPHRASGTPQTDFLREVQAHRTGLHRYCTRMLGSSLDGEDVVQDTLAAAFLRLDTLEPDRPLAPFLFRIAHNRCIDRLRRRRFESDQETTEELVDRVHSRSGGQLHRDQERSMIVSQQAGSALRRLALELPPRERSCFVLKNVLELSIEEVASVVGCGTGAVKSALHRARKKIEQLRTSPQDEVKLPAETRSYGAQEERVLRQFAELFNARDWAALAHLLADDVALDVVGVLEDADADVILGNYIGNYSRLEGRWRLVPARVDGEPVLVCLRNRLEISDGDLSQQNGEKIAWPVRLFVDGAGKVAGIRDYVVQAALLDEAFLLEIE